MERVACLLLAAATLGGLASLGCAPDAPLAIFARDAGDAAPPVETGAPTACPDVPGTAAMVRLGAFCIDLTEVPLADYRAWLATSPSTSGQPSECAANLDFAPHAGAGTECDLAVHPEVNTDPARPVVCVDWCDARAFCLAHGKHLCGRVGGGRDGFVTDTDNVLNDADRSEWYAACVGPDRGAYPYGPSYVKGTCFDDPAQLAPVAVGSLPLCHGKGGTPWGAVFDLSGNVAEWTDSCLLHTGGGVGELEACSVRGGWWKDSRPTLPFECAAKTDASGGLTRQRGSADNHVGFRCCG
ncbi:MAG: hypothetical protein NVS3B10_13530 [Polyangiales bacterium]